MLLFTISADYNGGTYISQLNADNPSDTVLAWAEALDVNDIPGFGVRSKAYIVDDLKINRQEGRRPVQVQGVINVWCTSSIIRGKLMIIDIIKTDST